MMPLKKCGSCRDGDNSRGGHVDPAIFSPGCLLAVLFPGRIFDIAPLLQPLFEGLILLAAVSDINLK